ncbi:MAG: hypothetical protein JSS62_05550 [Verrucomicrobia bacterium]|nr:hypothetical protein [Verrucomicrobiota bacterium]MBS0646366.1 hypothetical protein [Verrucomicrobiota bacterium]
MKSERLKKLEAELNDLQQWMKLGLVPKKELERHREEIHNLEARIAEERERLQFLKESGELEEYTAPRRGPSKTVYPDTPTMSDIEAGHETTEATSFAADTDALEGDLTEIDRGEEGGGAGEEEQTELDEDDEDPFSDRNRWRRGGIQDPDATEW